MMRRTQRGLSLIELMVGVLIGMLTVLAITQVLMSTEGRKRTTADGSDAQLNAHWLCMRSSATCKWRATASRRGRRPWAAP